MNWKPILKITSIFIMGIIVGVILMGVFTHYRIQQIHKRGGGEGFQRHILSKTAAESAEAKALEPIIEKYALKFGHLHQEMRQKHQVVLDSLRAEGSQVLSGTAKERFLQATQHPLRHRHHRKKRERD